MVKQLIPWFHEMLIKRECSIYKSSSNIYPLPEIFCEEKKRIVFSTISNNWYWLRVMVLQHRCVPFVGEYAVWVTPHPLINISRQQCYRYDMSEIKSICTQRQYFTVCVVRTPGKIKS